MRKIPWPNFCLTSSAENFFTIEEEILSPFEDEIGTVSFSMRIFSTQSHTTAIDRL